VPIKIEYTKFPIKKICGENDKELEEFLKKGRRGKFPERR
jgi:hypothetical protein